MEFLHSQELLYIKFLQQFRTPLLDHFFKSLTFFDGQEFLFVLIPILWMTYSFRFALKVFYLMMANALIGYGLKEFFQEPRPYHIDGSVGMITVGGCGFPSGAAQTVILLAGILVSTWKSRAAFAIAIPYVFFVSLSRIYLGVHFPTDVLGGWVVGGGLLLIYLYVLPKVEGALEEKPLLLLLLMSQMIPLFFLVFSQSVRILAIVFSTTSMGLGTFLAAQKNLLPAPARNWKEAFQLSATAVVGAFFTFELFAQIPLGNHFLKSMLQCFALGLWVSVGAQFVCLKIFAPSPCKIQSFFK